MDDLSVGRSVGLSSALWKNGGSDPDAVWHHRSGGSRDEACSGAWDGSIREGYFWGLGVGGHALVSGWQNIGLSNQIRALKCIACDRNTRPSQTDGRTDRRTNIIPIVRRFVLTNASRAKIQCGM